MEAMGQQLVSGLGAVEVADVETWLEEHRVAGSDALQSVVGLFIGMLEGGSVSGETEVDFLRMAAPELVKLPTLALVPSCG